MDTRTHLKAAEYETEADTFAIELLLPDDTFSEYLSAGYTSEQISRITGYAQRLIDLKASHIKGIVISLTLKRRASCPMD